MSRSGTIFHNLATLNLFLVLAYNRCVNSLLAGAKQIIKPLRLDLIRERYQNITPCFLQHSAPDTTFLTSVSVHSPGENILWVEFPDPHCESSTLVLGTRVAGCILGLFRSHVAAQ